jgi:hypothetical protein
VRNRRTLPSRQRIYIRLYARVDRLEYAISHFYSVINELRRRVFDAGEEVKAFSQKMSRLIESCWRVIEFLAHMPANTVIFITMAVLVLAATLIVLRRLI